MQQSANRVDPRDARRLWTIVHGSQPSRFRLKHERRNFNKLVLVLRSPFLHRRSKASHGQNPVPLTIPYLADTVILGRENLGQCGTRNGFSKTEPLHRQKMRPESATVGRDPRLRLGRPFAAAA